MARQSGSSAFGSTSRRGFASMDREKQRAIASRGGRSAHLKGTAHEFTSEEARIAGRKGGEVGGPRGKGGSNHAIRNASSEIADRGDA